MISASFSGAIKFAVSELYALKNCNRKIRVLFVLLHVARQVVGRVVLMYECSVDKRYTLQHVLQALSKVMAVSETHVLVEDDVNFGDELVTGMVRLQALDMLDRLGEAHGQVEQHVALVGRGCRSCQVADVSHGGQ